MKQRAAAKGEDGMVSRGWMPAGITVRGWVLAG